MTEIDRSNQCDKHYGQSPHPKKLISAADWDQQNMIIASKLITMLGRLRKSD